MKKIIVGSFLFCLFGTGCEKVITETPYSFLTAENFPSSATEADAALAACYTVLKSDGAWNYTGNLWMNSQNDVNRGGSVWTDFSIPAHGGEAAWWTAYWKGINSANDLISALSRRDAAQDPWITPKLAEARALRAYFYHNLASLFGDLPLRLKPTSETVLIVPRSPVKAIYDSIILPDINFADNKLPKVGDAGGRLSYGGVKCLMVDVYMKLAGWRRSSQGVMVAGDPKYWAMARDKAAEVLALEADGLYRLEASYSQVFTKLSTDVSSKEVIFDLQYTAQAGSNFPYVFGAFGPGPQLGGGNRNARPIPDWLRTRDTKDERYSWNIAPYQFLSGWTKTPLADTTQWGISTFQKIFPSTGYWQDYLTNFPLYRLADIKLLYAEAANEANGGPTAEAYKQINEIRYRARPADHKTDGTVLPDLSGLTQTQFREAIMEERSMELILEGKRHLDLVRWGNLKEKVEANQSQPVATMPGGMDLKFYLWSLPVADITTNGWQNNAGY